MARMILTVVGSHRATRRPELATVHMTVEFEGTDPRDPMLDAQQAARLLGNELLGLQAPQSSQEPSVSTVVVDAPVTGSMRPFDPTGGEQPLRYGVRIPVQATFVDFQVMGQQCAAWGAREGLRINHVTWELREESRRELSDEVLAGAVADAVRRAQVMARSLGANDVAVVEVADPGLLQGASSSPSDAPMMMKAFGAMGGSGEVVDLAPQEIVVEASVHVRLETR